jgi:hypothetical protein
MTEQQDREWLQWATECERGSSVLAGPISPAGARPASPPNPAAEVATGAGALGFVVALGFGAHAALKALLPSGTGEAWWVAPAAYALPLVLALAVLSRFYRLAPR